MARIKDYHFSYRQKDGGIQLILSYKVGNQWRQKSRQGFRTKREANEAKAELLAAAEKMAKTVPKNTALTLRAFYEQHVAPAHEGIWEPGTFTNYEATLNGLPELAGMPIAKIRYSDISSSLQTLRAAGLKASSINAYIRRLKRLFRLAVSPYHFIGESPAAELAMLKEDKNRKVKALSLSQLNALVDRLRMQDKGLALAACLAGYNGLRIGEIAALRYTDIDVKNETISITRQSARGVNADRRLKRPKSQNSVRVIPASPHVLEALAVYRRAVSFDGFLFRESYSNIQSRLTAAVSSMYPGFTAHSLRHTFATLLLKSGADIQTIAALIGDTPQVVMRVYIHYTDDLRRNAEALLKTAF